MAMSTQSAIAPKSPSIEAVLIDGVSEQQIDAAVKSRVRVKGLQQKAKQPSAQELVAYMSLNMIHDSLANLYNDDGTRIAHSEEADSVHAYWIVDWVKEEIEEIRLNPAAHMEGLYETLLRLNSGICGAVALLVERNDYYFRVVSDLGEEIPVYAGIVDQARIHGNKLFKIGGVTA